MSDTSSVATTGLQDDPLWLALERCLIRLRERPGEMLYDIEPTYERGLNIKAVNDLVRDAGLAGPVFRAATLGEDGKELDASGGEWMERRLYIFHPDNRVDADDPLYWPTRLRYLPLAPPAGPRLERTQEYLRAWQARRSEQLVAGAAGDARQNTPNDPSTSAPPLRNEFSSPADLAARYAVSQQALEARLRRWREKRPEESGKGWMEMTDRGPRQPQYLYRVKTVLPLVEELRTSGERRAKK